MSKKASRRIDSTARTALAGVLLLSALHGFEDHFVESVRRDTLHRVDHWMARWRRRLSDTGSLWVLAAGAALGVNVVKAVLRERRQAIESGRRSAVGGPTTTTSEPVWSVEPRHWPGGRTASAPSQTCGPRVARRGRAATLHSMPRWCRPGEVTMSPVPSTAPVGIVVACECIMARSRTPDRRARTTARRSDRRARVARSPARPNSGPSRASVLGMPRSRCARVATDAQLLI